MLNQANRAQRVAKGASARPTRVAAADAAEQKVTNYLEQKAMPVEAATKIGGGVVKELLRDNGK